ncbi:M48 family metalloprotease [Aquabacterium sp. OR-4]|uniref:M48 family metalloprotease n=1 Tax=Aquabacterium sp. OR-4 TaxID=2978127 RepID=UPI0028C74286|nr:M48 family metalloprotease [Aquabacterium sp. OR-4]MDT7833918.1 M48 family metalloprotease [Aquabacterium sp. OR-4]
MPTPGRVGVLQRRHSPRPPRLRPLCLMLAASLALLAGGPVAAQGAPAPAPALRLPSLGESASDEFGLSAEKRVGEEIMREIRRDPDYLDDAVLLAYVQSLWQPLVKAAQARGDIGVDTATLFPYEAFLVRDRSVNAFALPGGYVGVHLGLIAMTSSPDELASVLAHELSHVTQRHIARSVTAGSRSSSLSLAAMLLGLLVAGRTGNADVAQAAIASGQAAMVQAQLNFSRDMEREADRNGFALMADAGFAPSGMAAMFDKLDQANRLNDSGGFPYLRSHPLTVDRIGEARQRVETNGSVTLPPPTLRHMLMQARARVLMDASVQALRRLQDLDRRAAETAAPWAERLAAATGAALASTQLRDFARAERAAQQLVALQAAAPADAIDATTARDLRHLAAELALARADLPAARQALLPDSADASRTSLLLRARLALADGQPAGLRSSSEALQTWLAEHRHDGSAWMLMGQTADRQGLKLRAVRAEAEAQAALGNLQGAIDRLRAGQQLARSGQAAPDFIELSVIDSRLRDLQGQRRQLMAEQQQGQRGNRPDNGEGNLHD